MRTIGELREAFSDPVTHGVFIGDLTTAFALIDKKHGPEWWSSFNNSVITRLFSGSGKLFDSKEPISSLNEFRERIINWSLGVKFKGVTVLVLVQRNMSLIRERLYFNDEPATHLMFTRGSINRFIFDTIRDAVVPV